LEQRTRSAVNRCKQLCRPFQLGAGLLLSLFSLLVCVSLLLTSLDRAFHSDLRHGFSLQNSSSLPNPLDLMLVATQSLFPLDYILYTALIIFLVSCSTAGLTSIGIRCFCLSLYKIRAWKTPPRGMLMAILALIYIIMAQNVLIFSLVPDYTMFGNQHYNQTDGDSWSLVRCKASYLPPAKDICVPSRISSLLLAFHSQTWIFGAIYYFLTWGLIGCTLMGAVYSFFKGCSPTLHSEMEEDLIDSDDEEVSRNPFD